MFEYVGSVKCKKMKWSGVFLLVLVSGIALQEVFAEKGRYRNRQRGGGQNKGRRPMDPLSRGQHQDFPPDKGRNRGKSRISDYVNSLLSRLDDTILVNLGHGRVEILGNSNQRGLNRQTTTTHPPRPAAGRHSDLPLPYSGEWVRLRGQRAFVNAGVVEVYRAGRWGLVCDDSWDIKDASVVCRQLGFTQGAMASPGEAHYGVDPARWSNADILMDNVECEGTEDSVQRCQYEDRHDCTVAEAASVVCRPNTGCAEGWLNGGDTCYKFFGGAADIIAAEAHCQSLKAGLVSVESLQENHFLSNIISLTATEHEHVWYTSGRLIKNVWRWSKKTARSLKRPKEKGKSGKGDKRAGRGGKKRDRKRQKRAADQRMRTVRTAVEVTRWFPGWGDDGENREPSNKEGYTCLVLTDMFPLPNGTTVPVDYFYWKADRCRVKGGTLNFICEAPSQSQPVGPTECYTGIGEDYRGSMSHTDVGTPCISWSQEGLSEHTHPGKGLGDHNFCRNPDGDQRPWCWVERSKFGFCPVPLCSATTSPVTHTPAPALPPDTPNCPAEEFFCAQDNKCLPETFRCDGENDCDNGKDEENCEYNSKKFDEYTDRLPEKPLKNLTFVNTLLERCASYCMSSSFFPCLSFVYNRNQQLCQLLDSRDNATGHLRPADHYSYFLLSPEAGDCTGKFRCHNNRCIGAEELCNGFDDCGDSSDEQGCATQPPPMQVRLVDGDENSGRVEVFYLGIWGTVCDDKWDIRDATVVCRMLGYPGAKRATVIGEFGSGQGNIVLDEVECSGSEQNLQDCPALPWKQHDCQPFEAAGVVCSVNKTCDAKDFTCGSLSDGVSMCVAAKQVCDGVPSCPDSSDEADCQLRIELKNGSSPNEGRVELIRNGLRGTVCDDDWDQEEAAVVCRMLGFRLGGEAVVGGVFGQGTGLIWLDELKCAGLEGSLEDCPHDSWGTNDCSHLEDAGVKCYTRQYPATTTTTTTTPAPESVRVHLVGGSSPNRGRVEVDMGGMRGTVCDDSFDDRDAAVICRMAGFQEGGLAVSSSTYGPGSFLLPILVDELSCNGSEQSLLDCQRLPPGTHDCTHSEDAGVFCLLSGQVSPIRTTLSPFIATTSQPSVSILGDSQCGLRPMELSQRYRRQAEWQRGNEGEEGVEGGEGDLSAPRELSPFRIQKIVGGDMALHGMHPWQAGIQKIYNFYSNGEMLVGHWCGGTILNKHWILSAAHCFRNLPKSHLMVRVGDHGVKVDDEGEQKFLVEELISHPMYNFASHDYDIALLKIKAPDDLGIKFSDHVQPACLPASENDYIPGTECFISGWGETDTENERSSILRSARVPLLSHHVCNYLYKGDLTPRMLCAGYLEGGIDTCQGDSGGPLVCRINSVFAVLGITSWGNGCAKPNAPGIYTKTAKFLSWIQDTIRHHSA